MATATNIVLPYYGGKYGVWITDTVDPSFSMVLGAVDEADLANLKWKLSQNSTMWVPPNRKRPIHRYSPEGYWTLDSTMAWFIPRWDSGLGWTYDGQAQRDMLISIVKRHQKVLYRDPTGWEIFCFIKDFDWFPAGFFHYTVEFRMVEADPPDGMVVAA